jgi:hypothetical protein
MITYTEVPTSPGGGVITVNNAALNTLINTNSVVAGQQYLVTPVNFVNGSGVIVTGTGTNSVSSNGIGNFLNADYQLVGNYSGVPGYTATIGIWDSAYAGFTIGDVVIWNNKHYKSITGLTGTEPNLDVANWLYLPPSITNGYISESDFVTYDSNALVNAIVYREDKRENKVQLHIKGLPNTLLDFQWGRNDSKKNIIYGTSIFGATNCQATIISTFMDAGEFYSSTNHITPGAFGSNTITSNAILRVIQNSGNVIANNVDSAGELFAQEVQNGADLTRNSVNSGGNISIAGALYLGCAFDDNIVTQQSIFQFQNIQDGSEIRRNMLSGVSLFQFTGDVKRTKIKFNVLDSGGVFDVVNSDALIPSDPSIFYYNKITNKGKFTTPNFGSAIIGASNISYCIIRQEGIDYVNGFYKLVAYRVLESGFSNWQETLDFADPTICNPANLNVTIPTWMQSFVGEFECINVPLVGLSVTNITNAPPFFSFIMKPNSTNSLPINPISIGAAGSGDLVANSGVGVTMLVGRANGCDQVTLKTFGTFNGVIEISKFA